MAPGLLDRSPTEPETVAVAAALGSGSGVLVLCIPPLSSLVQSSATGPSSENSYPPRAQRSVRHLRRVVRQPSMTWKP